ncbi:DUF1878 family protein [Bacillus dakarensis]|uniref:DUF1878 family protein n=1 Tax=Robertmurraya dakarensis TaxID=1926278 RepID=UPI000980C195|nr:DUF1878 family protein [Bacillus dakarensis]
MNDENLYDRLNKLEFHQSLLLRMIQNTDKHFFRLVVEKSLTEQEVTEFYKQCESMSKELEEQKAEGFVYFHPLYKKFSSELHPSLEAEEVIQACLCQKLFLPLMQELKKYL